MHRNLVRTPLLMIRLSCTPIERVPLQTAFERHFRQPPEDKAHNKDTVRLPTPQIGS
jgi:hypothetical protein